MKKILFGVVASLLMSGCATTTGTAPKTVESKFDGSTSVGIMPHSAACTRMTCASIGATWISKYPDQVGFNIAVINQIAGISSASLNIDGEIIELRKIQLTDFDTTNMQSTNTYVTDFTIVDKILNSKRSWIRVATSKGNVEDAIIDGDTDSKAYHALKRFKDEVQMVKAKQ